LEKKAEADAERFAKYFRELAKWMPEPPSDWREKALPHYEKGTKKRPREVQTQSENLGL
jgi:hypothetical protein